MRRVLIALVISSAGLLPVLSGAGPAWADDPTPVATLTPSVTVTIPGATSSPTPTPSPSSSSGGGGGSSGGGGGSGGGSGDGGGGDSGGGDGGPSCLATSTSTPTPTPTPTSTPTPTPTPTRTPTPTPTPTPTSTPTLVPVVPATPNTDASDLGVKPDPAVAGRSIYVTAKGFTGGELIQLVIYPAGTVIGSYETDASGRLKTQLTLPEETTLGSHTLEATGYESCAVANGEFDVVSAAGSGVSIFPWIVWVIVGAGVLLMLIAFLLANALGWIPRIGAPRLAGGDA